MRKWLLQMGLGWEESEYGLVSLPCCILPLFYNSCLVHTLANGIFVGELQRSGLWCTKLLFMCSERYIYESIFRAACFWRACVCIAVRRRVGDPPPAF